MASDAQVPELSSAFERLLRHRDLSLFLPFLLGLTTHPRENTNTENLDQEIPRTNEAIILFNPFTQEMVAIEGTANLDSLFSGLTTNNGQPPASKASIEAMPTVDFSDIVDRDGDCSICLEEWEVGRVVKEMPCKHRFHGDCIEKWLGIHGSCPVCRYEMPFDEEEFSKKRDQQEHEEGGGERRRLEREIWVSFSFNSGRRNENSNQTPSIDPNEVDTLSTTHDQEMEN